MKTIFIIITSLFVFTSCVSLEHTINDQENTHSAITKEHNIEYTFPHEGNEHEGT